MPEPLPDASAPLKFKVSCDGYSLTIGPLDAKWQAKPFASAVLKPFISKFNARPDKVNVVLDCLQKVVIDGEPLATPSTEPSTLVSDVVKPGASLIELSFGPAPPDSLRFTVHSGHGESVIELKITLDRRFLRKSFADAVVAPFVQMYNRRVHTPVTPAQLVEFHVDGVKPSGSCGALKAREALSVLGHHPAQVRLFFSWDDVAQAGKRDTSSRFRFNVRADAAELQKARELEWDHKASGCHRP